MKRPAYLSSIAETPSVDEGCSSSTVAVQLSTLCTRAAQLHNAIGNQYYYHAPLPFLVTTRTNSAHCWQRESDAQTTPAAMQQYRLASEMLLLAEEHRDATCSIDQKDAKTSLMDYIADLEVEHQTFKAICMMKTSAVTHVEGTPMSFTLSTPPKEQAAAVMHNMSLVFVHLDRESEAVELLSMVEDLYLDSPNAEAATPSQSPHSRADVQSLTVSLAKAWLMMDTSALLPAGNSHAIRRPRNKKPKDRSRSVPTVLPSHQKRLDDRNGDGDCNLTHSSEPLRRRPSEASLYSQDLTV